MTPRESLEAAGWIRTPLYQGRWTDPVTKISCSEAAAILTQLARDEAKETSDARIRSGNGEVDSGEVRVGTGDSSADGNRSMGTGEVSDAPSGANVAPIATSVSAPDLAQKFHEAYERLAPQFGYETRKASAKPWAEVPENNRNLMTAVCEEILKYASSSSAAPKVVQDLQAAYWSAHGRAEAAESKLVREAARADYNAEAAAKNLTLVQALRDSRDRLREALRVALVPLAALVISGECLAAPTALSEELKVAIVSGHDAVLAALNPVPDTE